MQQSDEEETQTEERPTSAVQGTPGDEMEGGQSNLG
jgi:hypothetical protein